MITRQTLNLRQSLNLPTFLAILFLVVSVSQGQDTWPGESSDWNGFQKFEFKVDDKDAYVVAPTNPAPGNPWVWRARFPNFHAEADLILLRRGFHIVRINTDGMFGSPKAMEHWDRMY